MIKETKDILIYSLVKSERLIYTLDFFFKSKGQHYTLTNDLDHFVAYKLTKINYSTENLPATLSIVPSELLFEKNINSNINLTRNQKGNTWLINGEPDPLSVVFFFLSRYEEYISSVRDNFGRFEAKQSIAYQNGLLERPICDILVKMIWQKLDLDYSKVKSKFKTIASFDIDVAWAYKNKGWKRSLMSSTKDLLSGRFSTGRFRTMMNQTKDPFDNYELIQTIAEKHPTILFFLLGNWGKYDKNIHWENKALQTTITSFVNKAKIGIHPSFAAFLNEQKVSEEIERLNLILQNDIADSRQHFLRLKLPDSYQLLIKQGIKNDYTMGFADHFGFRAGTSFPFYFFDLKNNETVNFKIYPFAYMDGTLKDYIGMSPEESIAVIKTLREDIENVGGHFISVWHNHSIGDTLEWQGWQKVFLSNFPD